MNRPARLRRSSTLRSLVRENALTMNDFMYPIFIVEGEKTRSEISSMKDQYHLSVDMLEEELKLFRERGIKALMLFGTPDQKDEMATAAYDENGVVQRAVREIKRCDPEMLVTTDICLCQYKSDGHCCLFDTNGDIRREETLDLLDKVAVSHAEAGADMVAPSDMMDGRIGSMRKALDEAGFEHITLMSYSAKYASSYYGPFREAAHSAPAFGDRKAYQMDPANSREAIKEMELDVAEGADILMVKPAQPYMDIIKMGKERFNLPMAAYQVSGEYSMLRNAVDQGVVNESAIYESLLGIKRSGADLILTYFAKEMKRILGEVE